MLAPTWKGHCNTPLDRTCAYLEVACAELSSSDLLDLADMLHDLIRARGQGSALAAAPTPGPGSPLEEERTFAPPRR